MPSSDTRAVRALRGGRHTRAVSPHPPVMLSRPHSARSSTRAADQGYGCRRQVAAAGSGCTLYGETADVCIGRMGKAVAGYPAVYKGLKAVKQ